MCGGQRQGHQQRRQKLAGHIAAHLNGRLQHQVRLTDAQRGVTFVAQVIDVTTQQTQRIHQIANGALMHAWHTLEGEVTAHHGQGGGQGAHGGAGVAHEKFQSLRFLQAPTQSRDGDRGAVLCHAAAQLPQGGEHHAGVVRIQQVVDGGGAFAQGREQQHPVGNAFRAGQQHRARGTAKGGKVKEGRGVHAKGSG